MEVLLIDNYDSFTYNLVQMLRQQGAEVVVMKNDQVDWSQLDSFGRIVLSPGPGLPCEAGDLMKVLEKSYRMASILGVCLGHQAIAEFFGGSLFRLNQVLHGHQSEGIIIHPHRLFEGITHKTLIGHYHSWLVSDMLPDNLVVTMRDAENHIMAMKHHSLDIHGVQFHPESVMTPQGSQMIRNWLQM